MRIVFVRIVLMFRIQSQKKYFGYAIDYSWKVPGTIVNK